MGFLNIGPEFVFFLPGLLVGLTVHEFAHAWVAYRYGDPTAYWDGRVTLNPVAHIDPIGLISMVFFRFGWGKPVPVNPGNFRKPIEAQIAVSLAGIVANLLTLLASAILYGLLLLFLPAIALNNYVELVFYGMMVYNAGLAIFNLLPIPPLDGSKVLMMLLPYRYAVTYAQLSQQMGSILLIVLSYTGVLSIIIRPINNLLLQIALYIVNAIGNLW